jgi:hypothetical protein
MFMRNEILTLYLIIFYRSPDSVANLLCKYYSQYQVNPFKGNIECKAWAQTGSLYGYLQVAFCVSHAKFLVIQGLTVCILYSSR